ncbi:quinoprotein relay system zinc metallohydrolase 2 [uncultured Roseibium sp.]|uniref:quinoprotein relay system zinc metallohydrolase 2 n=1 Tax=uncultured Roseibium sp. TaxID=1936171 RepID=UPI003216A330
MFEIVVTLCLMTEPDICRQQLAPGFETSARADCEAVLTGDTIRNRMQMADGLVFRETHCRPMADGLQLTEIADNIFVHLGRIAEADPANLGDVSNIGVIIGETSIAVIDTGGSRAVGEALYRAIRQRSSLPISHVILTHVHPDHIFGASVFAETGAKVDGHPDLHRALLDREQSYLTGFEDLIGRRGFLGTWPVRPETAPQEIDLGGRVLTLNIWPAAHTTTDLTVMDSATGTLFAGDLIFHRHMPALDGSLKGWLRVLELLPDLKPSRIVPGHGGPVLTMEEALMPMRRYLGVLEADTRQALENGERLGEAVNHVGKSETDAWELFDLFNTRNATEAYTELEWE